MGAWEIGNFDNDTASDWLYEFGDNPTKKCLEKALDAVFEEEYIDSDIASEALAAIEVITLIKGNSKEKLEDFENIDFEILEKEIDTVLCDKSIKCINLILGKDNSELYELWEESDSFEDWKNVLLDLKKRVLVLS